MAVEASILPKNLTLPQLYVEPRCRDDGFALFAVCVVRFPLVTVDLELHVADLLFVVEIPF